MTPDLIWPIGCVFFAMISAIIGGFQRWPIVEIGMAVIFSIIWPIVLPAVILYWVGRGIRELWNRSQLIAS